MSRSRCTLLVLLAASAAAGPRSGHAYIHPADVILADVAARRARLSFKSIVAEGRTRYADGATADTTTILTPGRHRTEHRRADGVEVYFAEGARAYRKGPTTGDQTKVGATETDVLLRLLARSQPDPSASGILGWLRALKVDTRTISLDRLNGQVAYVIGARPGDLRRPQLWIDKALLVPVRLIWQGPDGLADLKLLDYRDPIADGFLPARIEYREGGAPKFSTEFHRVEVNAPVDPRRMKRPA